MNQKKLLKYLMKSRTYTLNDIVATLIITIMASATYAYLSGTLTAPVIQITNWEISAFNNQSSLHQISISVQNTGETACGYLTFKVFTKNGVTISGFGVTNSSAFHVSNPLPYITTTGLGTHYEGNNVSEWFGVTVSDLEPHVEGSISFFATNSTPYKNLIYTYVTDVMTCNNSSTIISNQVIT